ncbi:MAG: hypothetical protein UIM24_05665 [Clostridia bacterium]|nr:hypothetical protein [Clostridia bacterium]
MAREPEAMRDNIAAIREMFPDKLMFRIKDVGRMMGTNKYETIVKRFTFKDGYISIGDLARQMSNTIK